MKLFRLLILAILLAPALLSCEKIDNHRIPAVSVNIIFNTIGDWQRFGVAGAGESRNFIRTTGEPAGFPYTVSTYTGYGGVMLVCDPNGDFTAFDLSCPVERKPDILIRHDPDNPLAGIVRCPECGSTYNIYAGGGAISGEAAKMRYGLEVYHVFVGAPTIPYARISR